MADPQQALATQITNIQAKTGKTLKQLFAHVRSSKLAKHGEIVAMLKADFGIGHGDANTVAHLAKQDAAPDKPSSGDPLDAIYAGPKQALRPIHDALLAGMKGFGEFETAPKQKTVSYRRKRQFALIGPTTRTRVDLGLNIKELPESSRLEKLPPGQMCHYRVKLTDAAQVDKELLDWVRAAYDAAG